MKIRKSNLSKNICAKIAMVLLFIVFIFYPQKSQAVFPAISNVQSSVTTVSATITWTTDINSNSLVDYGATTSYGYTLGDTNASTTNHSVTLSGLSPDTSYKFRVRSADSNGDQTTDNNGGSGYSFATSPAAIISNVRLAEVTDTYATITWETNVSAFPYVAYGDTSSYGNIIGKESPGDFGTSHSITIAGFTAGTTNHYRPRVRDVYGNYTYYGLDSTFTTGAPYLTSFTSSTSNGTYGPGSTINITAHYTDSDSNNLGIGSSAVVLLDTGA